MKCSKCGSEMRLESGRIGIPFLQCVQYEGHKEAA